MAGTDPRFGLIPLPLSQSGKAVTNEFLVDPNTAHVYVKKSDGTLISKTVELENRLNAWIQRSQLVEDTIVIPGSRFAEATTDKHISIGSDGFTFNSVLAVNMNLFKMSYSKYFKYLVAVEYEDAGRASISVRMHPQLLSGTTAPIITGIQISTPISATNRYVEYECIPSTTYGDNGICYFSIMPTSQATKIKSITIKKVPLLLHEDIGFKQRVSSELVASGMVSADSVVGPNLKVSSSSGLAIAVEKFALKPGLYSITIPVLSTVNAGISLRIGTDTKSIDYSKVTANVTGYKYATFCMPIKGNAISSVVISTNSIDEVLIPFIDIELINTALYDHSYL